MMDLYEFDEKSYWGSETSMAEMNLTILTLFWIGLSLYANDPAWVLGVFAVNKIADYLFWRFYA